jgi:hypothetical protein
VKSAIFGALAFAAVLAGCAGSGVAPQTVAAAADPSAIPIIALKNPGFEMPSDPQRPCAPGWDCTMHADPSSFRFFHDERSPGAGKRSFCIEPTAGEPWALVSQGIHDVSIRGATLRFSLAVRVDGVTGNGAGAWVRIQAPQGGSFNRHRFVSGTQGWQRVAVQVPVPANAQIIEVGGGLEGRGRACFDDVRLELVTDSKNPV